MKKSILMIALLAAASTAMASGTYQEYNHGKPMNAPEASQQDQGHAMPNQQDANIQQVRHHSDR
jgi:uncharacterized membrane protein YebE (DUF533 family)